MIDMHRVDLQTHSELLTQSKDDRDELQNESVDANTFLLLMADIIASLPVNTTPMPADPGADLKQDGIEIGVSNNEEQLPAELSALNDNEAKPAESDKLIDNVAMTWINSASFQPPSAPQKSDVQESQINVTDQKETVMVNADMDPDNSNGINLKDLVLASPKTVVLNANMSDSENENNPHDDHRNNNESGEFILNSKTADDGSNPSINEGKVPLLPSLKTFSSTDSAENHDTVKEQLVPELILEHKANLSIMNPGNTNQNVTELTHFDGKTIDIPTDINSSQWADRFSERIIWLENQGIKSAVIKLNPDDLGPLEISIKVVKDTASVNISTPSTHVRELVDQALPRLREMMESQGLNLGDVQISADANAKHKAQQDQNRDDTLLRSNEEIVEVVTVNSRVTKGLIDYFA